MSPLFGNSLYAHEYQRTASKAEDLDAMSGHVLLEAACDAKERQGSNDIRSVYKAPKNKVHVPLGPARPTARRSSLQRTSVAGRSVVIVREKERCKLC